MTEKRLSLGKRGEELAAALLRKSGYRILETNYRGKLGEIDLIAEEGRCLVFVEVKTRSGLECGHPLEGIDSRKQRQLVRAAREYMARENCQERVCRFDAVSVLTDGAAPRLELVKNIIELDGDFF
ncbi:MAG: YraN family protein [Proteobacteria bacterium]|nr:YraN family protein [Pseudomonadota bacterium]MBU1737358.1 YraN family protein [Pseudomonadota bacterium]